MNSEKLPKHTESFWHKTSHVNEYPKLDKDLYVDVAIIGGGIAGILAAYEIAKLGKSVTLLEARKLIYGTTGFTTSKLSAQHNIIYNELIERYGKEKARNYYDANMEGIEIIKNIAKKHDIKCELKEQDAYVYTIDKSKVSHIKKEAKAYENLSIDGELVEKLPVDLDIEAGIVMHKQYEFHPVMFLSGVLK
ncbi:FAD-binding oxidoreductase [Senegalia massiliensis]|uniref:FAD-binding oxidoreductase n=1 Tax=Senegalia massiliensis TaxID=1720316 RepID=A0A845R1A3_9CLOT|nr:FAD-binding oxidoreductase [Senegalia massiliensis]